MLPQENWLKSVGLEQNPRKSLRHLGQEGGISSLLYFREVSARECTDFTDVQVIRE
jgi:hypothetical protein